MSTTPESTQHTKKPPDRTGLRVLVPLDETVQAQRALVYARGIAHATGGEIMLVRASGVEAEAGYDKLSNVAARLRNEGLSAAWKVVEGEDAVSAILKTADDWQPDLIIMTTMNRTEVDRWLHGGETEDVIKLASAPVGVVPPDWLRPMRRHQPGRLLVPLDGSRDAEHGLDFAIRLADMLPADLVLLRVVHGSDSPGRGAEDYVRQTCARVQLATPRRTVVPSVISGSPASAILRVAGEVEADAIVMYTRGSQRPAPGPLGRTVTSTLERSDVPVIVLGPRVLAKRVATRIAIGAPVRTLDEQSVGEVYRLVLDLEQQAVVAVVVLGNEQAARDVLVPIDCVETVNGDEVLLRLTVDEFDELPTFMYKDFTTPPPAWSSIDRQVNGPVLVPVAQRKRIGPAQHDVVSGARVVLLDDDLGVVSSIELDPDTAHLSAFWVRSDRMFSHDLRIPAEWVEQIDAQGELHVAGTRADIEAYLGYDRCRLSLP